MNLFQAGMPFWKGNLHCHTTISDGRLSSDEVIETYRDLGYHFLAITDHREFSSQNHMDGSLLLLSGIEIDYMLPGEALHIVGVGMGPNYDYNQIYREGPQATIGNIHNHGGIAIVAHPAWSLNTITTLGVLQKVTAAEIFNSYSNSPWDANRGDASQVLDVAAAHGAPFRFVASDDSHQYSGEQGKSYTMVQAEALTPDALLHSLRTGCFYASQGPTFQQISIASGILTIASSPVERIIFYSNLPWVANRCRYGTGLTTAQYDLRLNEDETFVRCQLIDSQGRSAWSNPILLGGPEGGRFL